MRIGHWWSDENRGTPNFGIIMTGTINVLGGGAVSLQHFPPLIPNLVALDCVEGRHLTT